MEHRQVLLHSNGPALWPEHKSLAAVLELQATTPDGIWHGTYQGNPSPPGGSIFKRSWWHRLRFDASEREISNMVVGRWISWDTALKDKEGADYSAYAVGELMPDYRLNLREAGHERWEFPALPAEIERVARKFNRDEKLRGIIIEDRASGTSAYQTLMATANERIQSLLFAFNPTVDKSSRANQAAVWCRNESILLPWPGPTVPWLIDFEDELFSFPSAAHNDQVDAFSQLILYVENLLAEGWRARQL